MYFAIIIIATIMVAFQFFYNDGYRRETNHSFKSALKFTLYTSVVGLIVLLPVNKMHLELSLFSLATACVYSGIYVAFCYVTLKAMEIANLSVYSVFSMIGGMVLPFVYGILCGEEFRYIRLVCCLFVGIALFLSIKKGKQDGKAFIYYIAVFIFNGLFGVISKFHQFYTAWSVDSGSFMILIKITSVLFSMVLLLMQKKRSFSINAKAAVCCSLYAVLNAVGNLMFLIALLHVPASVQYPVITGGVIVSATIIDVLRGEKLTKKEIASACIAFAATVLMAV